MNGRMWVLQVRTMRFPIASGLVVLSALIMACSGSNSTGSGFEDNGNGGGKKDAGTTGNQGDDDDDTTGNGGDAGSLGSLGDSGPGPGQGGCTPDPSFYDIPGDNCDNDGDGKVDNVLSCDTSLSAGGDAMAFAQAIGLCQTASASDTKWGVISATYTNGHKSTKAPNDQQHGILPKFGNVVKPREGSMLGVLSSGTATEMDGDPTISDPFGIIPTMGTDGQFKGAKAGMQPGGGGDAPTGFPKQSPSCGTGSGIDNSVNDVVNVKIQLRVPKNAKGFSFDFDFWSGEWPDYVCSSFNDSFIAFLTSKGTTDNVSFDANGNPVSVNNGFFDRCTSNAQTGCAAGAKKGTAPCPGGIAELAGTGFDDQDKWCNKAVSTGGGATGWLTSSAPVEPGETVTLEFMIWDTGDASYDSSVLVDNFVWAPNPVSTGTTRPPPK